ncbi:hypothetical protein E2C01_100104 [Portunus trituberculatus]|uniref:Uncharacterized protein n=1 Tax=Portunus trituberculatus TaxID=210409 RepID=A0A5B7KGJ5_PORTR|nr:hypothetical protein [Portunus trituberculatus]
MQRSVRNKYDIEDEDPLNSWPGSLSSVVATRNTLRHCHFTPGCAICLISHEKEEKKEEVEEDEEEVEEG